MLRCGAPRRGRPSVQNRPLGPETAALRAAVRGSANRLNKKPAISYLTSEDYPARRLLGAHDRRRFVGIDEPVRACGTGDRPLRGDAQRVDGKA